MPSTASRAGVAASTPAAAELPRHDITDVWGDRLRVRCTNTVDRFLRAFVHVEGRESDVTCEWLLTPDRARQLAVYLVDCANALDNPAQRVIVDSLDLTAMHPCSECGALTDCPGIGEGLGHE